MKSPQLPQAGPEERPSSFLRPMAAALAVAGSLAGCENTGDGAGTPGYQDPYYYGSGYYGDPDRDYPNRPGAPPRVEHPIARPPVAPMPRVAPMGGGFRR
jgi:hypothetical protein